MKNFLKLSVFYNHLVIINRMDIIMMEIMIIVVKINITIK